MNDKGAAGPLDFSGTDRGDKPFVELHETTTGGYDGILYVGRLTAAPPAKERASKADDVWERLQQLVLPVLFEKAATTEQ